MTDSDIGYVAGLLDGEGTILLKRARGRAGFSGLVPVVEVYNCDRRILEALLEATAVGAISERTRQSSEHHRRSYVWRLNASEIRIVLKDVLDHLRGKRRQAELILRLLEMKDTARTAAGWSEEVWSEADAIYRECRSLNARGGRQDGQFILPLGSKPALGARPCSVPDCERRRYLGNDLCYDHWRQHREKETLVCEYCGEPFESADVKKARFCGPKCQFRSWEERVGRKDPGRTIGKYRKLTPTERAEIIGLWKSGERDKVELARAYGVDRTTIANVVKGLDETRAKQCEQCGKEFACERSTARYCSKPCIKKAEYWRNKSKTE